MYKCMHIHIHIHIRHNVYIQTYTHWNAHPYFNTPKLKKHIGYDMSRALKNVLCCLKMLLENLVRYMSWISLNVLSNIFGFKSCFAFT